MGNWDELNQALADAVRMFRQGNSILASRGWQWIRDDLWLHGGGVAFAGYVAVLEAHGQPAAYAICVPAAFGAWTLAAWALANGQPQPAIDVDRLAAACHEIGSPHAHIQALADRLEATTDEVRACCAQAGVPVADGVRMQGRGVSTGVRAQDFPPLPSAGEEPTEGVLSSENNSNNAIRKETREGMLIFYDDSENRRYKVKKP